MEIDRIIEIGIDSEKRLYVKPSSKSFPFIYREAMEIHWDESKSCLYGAEPKLWTYIDWFVQILSAAKQQGCELKLASNCIWNKVPESLKGQIMEKNDSTNT